MNAAKRQISRCADELRSCEILRKWQKNSVKKRCSLQVLAKTHSISLQYLKSFMKKGLRCRARDAAAKRHLLGAAVQTYRAGNKAKRICRKPVRTVGVKVRKAQRVVSALRASHRNLVKRYWAKWHKGNPNVGLADDQYADMVRCSPWMR